MRNDSENLAGVRLGPFAMERRLGVGGMGIVYLARDTSLDRPVAVKVLHSWLAREPIMVERFQREAKAAARLNHPHIVQIHAVGQQDSISYIAMEFVDGVPLETVLREQGPLPWQRSFGILWQVASALECAHGNGIIHRDIKPANILIDKQGRARVSDFGVAKVLESQHQLTTDRMFVGTPAYASPEQCGVGKVCPASDLFSLGATVYETLTGRLPFKAETPAELVRMITMEPFEPLTALLPDIPHPARIVVETLLEKDLERRYASARELLDELDRLRAGQTLDRDAAARTVSEIEEAVKASTASLDGPSHSSSTASMRRRSFPWKVVGGVAALAVAVLGIARWIAVGRHVDDAKVSGPVAEPVPAKKRSGEFLRDRPLPPIDAFDRYDVNKDGRVTPDELPPELRDRFMRADTNGDGAVSRQEFDAFRRRLVQRRVGAPQDSTGRVP